MGKSEDKAPEIPHPAADDPFVLAYELSTTVSEFNRLSMRSASLGLHIAAEIFEQKLVDQPKRVLLVAHLVHLPQDRPLT